MDTKRRNSGLEICIHFVKLVIYRDSWITMNNEFCIVLFKTAGKGFKSAGKGFKSAGKGFKTAGNIEYNRNYLVLKNH